MHTLLKYLRMVRRSNQPALLSLQIQAAPSHLVLSLPATPSSSRPSHTANECHTKELALSNQETLKYAGLHHMLQILN